MQIPKWTAAHSQIREILLGIYDEKLLAKQVAKDTGLDWGSVDTNGPMRSVWHSIVDQARLQAMLPELIDVVAKQYPIQSQALRQALAGDHPSVASPTNIRDDVQWRTDQPAELEKIMGKQSTLLPIGFLELGLQRARSVARVVIGQGESGTGFLVAGNWLITNNHVLPSQDVTARAVVEFNFEKSTTGLDKPVERFQLLPEQGFATSKERDWTVVRVAGNANDTWGAIPLNAAKVAREDRVVIIQHPGGGPKQIALTHNLVTYADDNIVQYLTDTMPGSSGSPVFNEAWEVVALHHSGGWLREPGSKEQLFRNEGIAIGQIISGSRELLNL